jgi:hypothetical protein
MVAPSVADDRARLRFFVSAAHSERELRTAVTAVSVALASLSADPARGGAGRLPEVPA